MERREFVAEGKMEIGPKEEFFVFLGGDHLGRLLTDHFGLAGKLGYCDLELAPIGWQRLALDLAADDQTAVSLPVDTFATRLLARPLRACARHRRAAGESEV